jgi:hypothetical protein
MALAGWSTTSYLQQNSSVISGPPCSFACWVNYPVSPAPYYDVQFACWSNTSGLVGTDIGLYLDPSGTYGPVNCLAAEVNGGNAYPADTAFSTAACALGSWQHLAATWQVSGGFTLMTVYVNGANKGTKTYANIPSGLIQSLIGNDPRASGVQSTGPLAVPCFWNIALSDGDVALLATGYRPTFMHPANIVSYPILTSLASPLPDLVYPSPWLVQGSGLVYAADPPNLYSPVQPLPTVQQASGINSTAATNTLTATLASASIAGDILEFVVQWNAAVTITSITDNANGTNNYVPVMNGNSPVNSYNEVVYQVTNLKIPASGNLQITVTFSGNFTNANLAWIELTNVGSYAGVDLLGNISVQITSKSNAPASNLNLLANSEFLIAAWISDTTTVGITPVAGWTSVFSGAHKNILYSTNTGTAPLSLNVGPVTIAGAGSQGVLIVVGLAFSPVCAPIAPVATVKNKGRFAAQGLLSLQNYLGSQFGDLAWIGGTAADPGWLMNSISGITLRIHAVDIWLGPGSYDWSYLDWAFQAANQTGKIIGFSLIFGVSTPLWVSNQTTQFTFSGFATPAPPPWDTTFQGLMATFLRDLFARYGGNQFFSYFELSGMGRGNQAGDWCQSNSDNAELLSFATSGGYSPADSGVAIWVAGTEQIGPIFESVFANVSIVFTKGGPVFPQDPAGYFTALTYLLGLYQNFGLKDNALDSGYNAAGLQTMATYLTQYSPKHPAGMQRNHPATLASEWSASMDIALGFGCQFIEIYPSEETLVSVATLAHYNALFVQQARKLVPVPPPPPPWEDGPLVNPQYCGQNQVQQIQVPASIAYKYLDPEEGPWAMPPYASIYPPPTQSPGEAWAPPPVKQIDIFTAQQTFPL